MASIKNKILKAAIVKREAGDAIGALRDFETLLVSGDIAKLRGPEVIEFLHEMDGWGWSSGFHTYHFLEENGPIVTDRFTLAIVESEYMPRLMVRADNKIYSYTPGGDESFTEESRIRILKSGKAGALEIEKMLDGGFDANEAGDDKEIRISKRAMTALNCGNVALSFNVISKLDMPEAAQNRCLRIARGYTSAAFLREAQDLKEAGQMRIDAQARILAEAAKLAAISSFEQETKAVLVKIPAALLSKRR